LTRSFTATFANQWRGDRTLGLPFVPSLDAFGGGSIGSIIAFDALWLHHAQMARAVLLHARTDDGTTDCARVDRTINGRPRMGCGESEGRRQCRGPAEVLVTSAARDGERCPLGRWIGCPNQQDSCMTTTSTRTLNPIIRDRVGAVHPVLAAIASITGQPLTAVVQVARTCIADLKGLAGLNRDVSVEDACHAALCRFGYDPHRLYADEHRRPRMGELLRTYARSPGPCERLFAICESGDAFAFLGGQVATSTNCAPTALGALVRVGTLDLDAPVHFAFTVIRRRVVEPVAPDHKFLEAVAEWAFALADAYNIEVIPVSWPYWNLSFPNEMTDGTPGSGALVLVCGEHELLCVINDRVRQLQRANEMLGGLLTRLRCDPPVSWVET